jgi:hypothetical protein
VAETKKAPKPRKRALNKKIIASNISEAQAELAKLLHRLLTGTLNETALQVGLRHAYHHLNFAWNIRHVSKSRYASLSRKEFEEWGRYPADIDED